MMKEVIFQRNTTQREVILDVIRNTEKHPCANTIYEEARKKMPHISKGTVYRNIKLLAQAGVILELKIERNVLRYDGSVHTHSHLYCEKCGCVIDVDLPNISDLAKQVTQKGVKIHNCKVEFQGLCTHCN